MTSCAWDKGREAYMLDAADDGRAAMNNSTLGRHKQQDTAAQVHLQPAGVAGTVLTEDGGAAKGVDRRQGQGWNDPTAQEHEHEQRAEAAAQGVACEDDLGIGTGAQMLQHHGQKPVIQILGRHVHAPACALRELQAPVAVSGMRCKKLMWHISTARSSKVVKFWHLHARY